jgi:hypothetical protein
MAEEWTCPKCGESWPVEQDCPGCGRPQKCLAVVEINGGVYGCIENAPHHGLAHRNVEAQAIWCCDQEVREYMERQN